MGICDMTKKDEKAARVAADKRAAWIKKVRTLLGHVRIEPGALTVAYSEGKDANTYAAEIAALEPVGRAVHPLKVQAIKRAGESAKTVIEGWRKMLEENNWDAYKVAPYPNSSTDSRFAYLAKQHDYYQLRKITSGVDGRSFRRHGDPEIVEMNPEGCERLVTEYERDAATEYDAFIVKLVAKIGPCVDATLDGSHIWSHSILTVTKTRQIDGLIGTTFEERWKTQQIENVSKLGKYFPQWPSRLMK